jgi:solute carrier family 40 (iron-regulated transporter), member 1
MTHFYNVFIANLTCNNLKASLSAALQSFTVLSLSGPMTTYLLTRRYSLSLITTARTFTSVIEISSTVVFPIAVSLLSRVMRDPISIIGFMGISWQVVLLIPTFIALVLVPTTSEDPASSFPLLTVFIFLFLGLSRLGNWVHNISVQQIVQTRVPAKSRVEFSGVEMTFISGAEIGRWACAAIWAKPEEFKGIALGGLVGAILCWILFTAWFAKLKLRQQAHSRPR